MAPRVDGGGFATGVVVAAGASARMGGRNKLAEPLLGRPVLAWAVESLARARSVREILVVAAPDGVAELRRQPWIERAAARVVAGAERRQGSVAAGVRAAGSEVVLVHDGARPLATAALADRVATAALEHGAAIPVMPVAETLKRVADGRVVTTVDREGVATAQTPQGARRDLLLDAYERFAPDGAREFTDEAALLEAAGVAVITVDGEPDNLKITRPDDLDRAAALLEARASSRRVALGSDSHPFGPGDGLALGGLVLRDAPRLHGHSDGDAALHAIADGLLGAAGMGDLGRLFPAGDPATRDIDSARLVATVVARLSEAGWRPAAVDLTLLAGRPRFGGAFLDAMADRVGTLLELHRSAVSVRASSGNLTGPEAAGRAISATALVSIVREPGAGDDA